MRLPTRSRPSQHPRPALVLAALVLVARSAAAQVCTPVEKWRWDAAVEAPLTYDPCGDPLVVQLTDDNADRVIDGRDDVDVVIRHYGAPQQRLAEITVLDGRTRTQHYRITSPSLSSAGIAAGDVDGDGLVEIVAVNAARTAFEVFENDGTWAMSVPLGGPASDWDSVGIADFDQDGTPELYLGSTVVRLAGGGFTGSATEGASFGIRFSGAADLVPTSPGLELVAGPTAYAASGTVLWTQPLADGWTAIADFDGGGDPEVALANPDGVYLLDGAGNVLGAPFPVGFLPPGQPAAADLDGDGVAEAIVAARTTLYALKWGGSSWSAYWMLPIDDSSGIVGPSTFDLDRDGFPEVLYRDQQRFMLIDGRSGGVLASDPFNSATIQEAPVVADIDGDCEAEILVTSCMGGFGGFPHEVRAYDCSPSAPARPLWNQYSYHVTNVNDDGTIPRVETPPWTLGAGWINQVRDPGCGATLDVRFARAAATRVPAGGAVEVAWSTLLESDTSGFLVERAARASGPWTELGFVDAVGPGFAYAYRDAAPPAGALVYRVVELTSSGRGDATPALAVGAAGAAPAARGGATGARSRRR